MSYFIRTSMFKVAYPMAKIKAKHPADTQFVDDNGKSKAGKTYSYKELKALKDQGHPDGAHYDDYVARRDHSNAMNDQWLKDHPADPNNIVNTFHAATPTEYNEGKNWYSGANYTAHIIARDVSRNTGKRVTADQITGLIANYSPQMAWHGNMKWASEAAHAAALGNDAHIPGWGGKGWKSPHSGKGGMFTDAQSKAAKAIMEGQDWRQVLGKLKIGNFGGNISTGGIGNPKKDSEDVGADEGTGHSRPKITIDRHALSGVQGDYSDEGVYNRSGLDKAPIYDQYVDHFNNATKAVNDLHGEDLHPAQMQAITWVTRQRQNGEQGHTTAKNAEVAKKDFDGYASKFHPDLVDNTPGVGFQGAGGMATNIVGGTITPKETFHGMPSWDEDVASGVDPHPNHPLAASGAAVAQPQQNFAHPMHPLNAGNQTMAEKAAAQQPQQAVANIRTASSKTWQYNAVNNQYTTSKLDSKFSCNCGKIFTPSGFNKCACGQTWASFDIVPQDKTAKAITRVVRPVKEHRDRILAKKADMAGVIGGDKDVPQSTDPADTTDIYSADSENQEPDRSNSATISNEFTEGIKPSGPYFVRNQSDAAPVVFDKQAFFVRSDHPTVPRHLDPGNPGGPQWQNNSVTDQQSVQAPIGTGTLNNELDNPRPHVQGFPGAGQANQKMRDPLMENLDHGGLKNEVENNLALDTGKHHIESPGRHRANRKSVSMFNEEEFKLGWAHATNDGRLPKVASRSFIEGYAESLKQVVGDRAPGWDTVAPAFEKDPHPTSSDYQDRSRATDDGEYKEVRKDLADKLDGDNAAGQSRGNDNGQKGDPNAPVTDVDGWNNKKSSAIDFSGVTTAALAREIARRSNA